MSLSAHAHVRARILLAVSDCLECTWPGVLRVKKPRPCILLAAGGTQKVPSLAKFLLSLNLAREDQDALPACLNTDTCALPCFADVRLVVERGSARYSQEHKQLFRQLWQDYDAQRICIRLERKRQR